MSFYKNYLKITKNIFIKKVMHKRIIGSRHSIIFYQLNEIMCWKYLLLVSVNLNAKKKINKNINLLLVDIAYSFIGIIRTLPLSEKNY